MKTLRKSPFRIISRECELENDASFAWESEQEIRKMRKRIKIVNRKRIKHVI